MATRPSLERRKLLTRRFQHVLNTLGDSTANRLHPAWASLGEYNEAQIPEFSKKATPILNAAKLVAVKHAAAFYALSAGIPPVGVAAIDVPVEPNLREPFISVWQALKSGRPYEVAVEAGALRLNAVSADLVFSSAMRTGDAFAKRADSTIVAWERVPDDTACPWCEEVSPGPILTSGIAGYLSCESADAVRHDNCGCTADPIFADEVTAA